MRFAPLIIPWERRFQTLGALHYLTSFVFLAPTCYALLIYSFFTRLWPLSLLYLLWLWVDRKTPDRGGRPFYSVRNWAIWYGLRDYFPVKCHKTTDLDPKRNYMLVCHPHGVLCPGSFVTICSKTTEMGKLFPSFESYLTMLPFWFRIPFYRDYIMAGGLVPSSKKCMQRLLNKPEGGNLVAVLPGGAEEALDARPGDMVIIIRQRMGFVKIAMVNGIPLVPCISFGDHEVWDQVSNPKGSKVRAFQQTCMKKLDVAFPLFSARGIFQYDYGLMPRRRPLNFVVGEPMEVQKNSNPTSEELVNLREKYIEKVQELFEKHKSKYLDESVKLVIN